MNLQGITKNSEIPHGTMFWAEKVGALDRPGWFLKLTVEGGCAAERRHLIYPLYEGHGSAAPLAAVLVFRIGEAGGCCFQHPDCSVRGFTTPIDRTEWVIT